ncbi:unnamed protein product [Cladocopium goreaui]|uniref:Uncharacterized protein n=1 Tax=Cladocopium goreaui TaxID=2562237 RepID=A0A9P1D286_9DINO|nr:unnamed protein product [Cladocopium goreaui]
MAEKAKELQDRITATAGRVLIELNWPGNGVRELLQRKERLEAAAREVSDVPAALWDSPSGRTTCDDSHVVATGDFDLAVNKATAVRAPAHGFRALEMRIMLIRRVWLLQAPLALETELKKFRWTCMASDLQEFSAQDEDPIHGVTSGVAAVLLLEICQHLITPEIVLNCYEDNQAVLAIIARGFLKLRHLSKFHKINVASTCEAFSGMGDDDFDDEEGGPDDEDEEDLASEPQEDVEMAPRLGGSRGSDGENRDLSEPGSMEEELRMLGHLRAMEQIISEVLDPAGRSRRRDGEDFALGAPMASLRIRMGGSGSSAVTKKKPSPGVLESWRLLETAGLWKSVEGMSQIRRQKGIATEPLRWEFPSFVRSADASSATATLDYFRISCVCMGLTEISWWFYGMQGD